MSNRALGSFMKDLISSPVDSNAEVSIVDDNASCLPPDNQLSPTRSPEPKQRRSWGRYSDGARSVVCSPAGKPLRMDAAMEATIRSHLSTRVEVDLSTYHRKKESRWQSISRKTSCCETNLATPKRTSCPASLMVDLQFPSPATTTKAAAEDLVRVKTACDEKLRMPKRISPIELDICLSEILADAKSSTGSLSLDHVEEAIDIAESFPKLDACLG